MSWRRRRHSTWRRSWRRRIRGRPGRIPRFSTGASAARRCRRRAVPRRRRTATTVRPRERALDIEGSMTPTARRMASLVGSSCCQEEADRLLAELADVNFGGVESTQDDAGGDSPGARRLLRELAAAGHSPEDVGVCIGAGAEWLRRLFDEVVPERAADRRLQRRRRRRPCGGVPAGRCRRLHRRAARSHALRRVPRARVSRSARAASRRPAGPSSDGA